VRELRKAEGKKDVLREISFERKNQMRSIKAYIYIKHTHTKVGGGDGP
jgi:hypothetical protein